jgi:regulator of sigma E protease
MTMIVDFVYIFLAILALSFLIFIHELGHYWMARRVGMRVETFAIGFGRPLFSWTRKGVRWQIGWLPFGGYVKIAGQEIDKDSDPYKVPGGFFEKSPLDRIKVAFMGPFVNILFAFFVFALIWLTGGRDKTFAEYTHVIGWIDPHSELYQDGVRPGDEITSYNDQPYTNAGDNIYIPTINGDEVEVKGFKLNYETGEKTPFSYKVKTYPHPYSKFKNRGFKTAGILNPSNYFIYQTPKSDAEHPFLESTSVALSGIHDKDRVIWVDGEVVFSLEQLSHILNDHRALLTVLHHDKVELRRVPRVELQELKLDQEHKEEFIDWQHEAQLNALKTPKLIVIPYNLNPEGVVESALKYIDKDKQEEAFPNHPYSSLETPLETGDKILAVDGAPISYSYQLLSKLQQHEVNIIVDRNPLDFSQVSWKEADVDFYNEIDCSTLSTVLAQDPPSKMQAISTC